MALDHSLVGVPGEPQRAVLDVKDALLYAVGVGAGLGDPLQELEFTTENTRASTQQVLPTFARADRPGAAGAHLGDFDRALLVHAEQSFELHRPLPVEGTVRTVSTVTGIYDKGSGALVSPRTWPSTRRPASRWSPRARHVHPRRGRLRRRPRRRRAAVGRAGPRRPTTGDHARPGRSRR